MGQKSKIEWTDATWNPTTGCTKVSDGCDHCYAHKLAHERLASLYTGQLPVIQTPQNIADPFSIRLWPNRLRQPASWRQPRIVFVNSMSDLFHADVPDAFVRQVFEVMLKVDRHVYQVLTKRPARAVRFFRLNQDLFPSGRVPRHIWMGTSVENQAVAYRIAHLRKLPAEVRFLSCEPLLGPLQANLTDIHWVIAGGESGAEFRPMEESWAIGLRDQCRSEGTPFFFKQWGGRRSKAGGRMLDGRTWDEMPIADRLPENVAPPLVSLPPENRRRVSAPLEFEATPAAA
ncbi:MAG TPA: phage Gp37/Gp68 family protein [Longimicrobium sp.]|nr:phage Gp37/Gp68 family protein [Longimicrobium sp.]